VIVAVIAVRMVEASVDQVIRVVLMRNRLMAAAWAMPMRLLMSGSAMLGSLVAGRNHEHEKRFGEVTFRIQTGLRSNRP